MLSAGSNGDYHAGDAGKVTAGPKDNRLKKRMAMSDNTAAYHNKPGNFAGYAAT